MLKVTVLVGPGYCLRLQTILFPGRCHIRLLTNEGVSNRSADTLFSFNFTYNSIVLQKNHQLASNCTTKICWASLKTNSTEYELHERDQIITGYTPVLHLYTCKREYVLHDYAWCLTVSYEIFAVKEFCPTRELEVNSSDLIMNSLCGLVGIQPRSKTYVMVLHTAGSPRIINLGLQKGKCTGE